MSYTIIFVSIVIAISIIFLRWHVKFRSDLKSIEKDSEVSIEEFETLCTPIRFFSDDEVRTFLENKKGLLERIYRISTSWLFKNKDVTQYSFYKLQRYYDCILTHQRDNNELFCSISYVNENLPITWRAQNAINAECIYQSHHSIERHKEQCAVLLQKLNLLINNDCLKHTSEPGLARTFIEEYNTTIDAGHIKRHNDKFVANSKAANKEFFDTCLTYPLDDQQRDAILHLEDNSLVISSAGSGKTSTMVGKARYMVDVQKMDPSKILIMTYTRKAAGELAERLNIEGLTSSTFHALALKVIASISGEKPTIADPGFMLNAFYSLLQKDTAFKSAINKYVIDLRTLMKLEHDYDTAEAYYADRKKIRYPVYV